MEVAAPCPPGSRETKIEQFDRFDSERFDEHPN